MHGHLAWPNRANIYSSLYKNFWTHWIKILEKQTTLINASRVITGTWSLDIIGKKLQSSVHKSVQNHELETF